MADAFLGTIPLGKMGEPDDIAELVVFLASEQAKYITGQTISVNGGALIC
ncbi:SDR family oxidoreductase [Chloroflexota bacterium]